MICSVTAMDEDQVFTPVSLSHSSRVARYDMPSPKRKVIRLETKQPFPDGASKLHGKDQLIDKHDVSSSVDSSDSPRFVATVKRKETARRQLLGSIYTKHKAVGRSFSFVAGEIPQSQIRLPRVHYKDKTEKEMLNDQASNKRGALHTNTGYSRLSDNKTTSGVIDADIRKPVHRTNSQKLSLPDIIMDFNMETNTITNDRIHGTNEQDSESEDDVRAIGASYEDYLKPKLSLNNPYKAKYRPVTPGLLDSLNKLKLPSKVKTEQWLKSSQSVQKSYCFGSYKVGNLHNSNLTYRNWIYTDT